MYWLYLTFTLVCSILDCFSICFIRLVFINGSTIWPKTNAWLWWYWLEWCDCFDYMLASTFQKAKKMSWHWMSVWGAFSIFWSGLQCLITSNLCFVMFNVVNIDVRQLSTISSNCCKTLLLLNLGSRFKSDGSIWVKTFL